MIGRIYSKHGGTVPVIIAAMLSGAMIVLTIGILYAPRISADSGVPENVLTVSITADGRTLTAETEAVTVGELLACTDIVLGENDEVNVPLTEEVTDGMKLKVSRIEYRLREKSTFIPYETEYTETPLLKMGDSEVKTAGIDGSIAITIEDKYVNGKKLSSCVIATQRTEPVNEVIAQGTALQTPYSKREGNYRLENGIPTEYAYKLSGKVTSYTAPEGSGTYSGRPLVIGSVGVDPDVIPFGSEVYIVSQDGSKVYGYAIASDTGDITDIIADAYMGVTSEHWDDAMAWCAQFCDVYVLTVGDNSVSWR